MKVCIMGLGYIGFPTACLLAKAGHQVLGVDVNPALVERLRRGELHIVNEDGLADLAREVLRNGSLRVSLTPAEADAFILAVPTPFQHFSQGTIREQIERPETEYRADLSAVAAVTRSIAPFVRPGNLVILESTVPPGTTENVVLGTLVEAGVDVSGVFFAHAPERVLPGNMLHELVHNDRIVGGLTPEAAEAAAALYRTFVKGEILLTDATTAELVKLMENTFRDVNIALANEFARVCEHLGVDVWEAIELANRHPRVNFLRPGPGVGGHCIAVDPCFVVEKAPGLTPLIQAARRVNRRMPLHVVELLSQLAADRPITRVAILGASYKANVGDDRESPALEVAGLLVEEGMEVRIHDPYIERYNGPVERVLDGAEAVLLLTDHNVYRSLDPERVGQLVANRLLLDTRGLLDAARWREAGFQVLRLGDGRTRIPAREVVGD